MTNELYRDDEIRLISRDGYRYVLSEDDDGNALIDYQELTEDRVEWESMNKFAISPLHVVQVCKTLIELFEKTKAND